MGSRRDRIISFPLWHKHIEHYKARRVSYGLLYILRSFQNPWRCHSFVVWHGARWCKFI
ncbi:hypothetical protein SERLA73DRAFT_130682, partial [Serpula lacrymans var. lacrymans S7.3]